MTAPASVAAKILARDGRTCVYCLDREDAGRISVDHVRPEALFDRGLATGDRHEPTNLVTACITCNSLKRDMTLRVFALYLEDSHGWTPAETARMVQRVEVARNRPLPE